ncbi:MAG: radical SAM protein [Endomicrobium sp.]|nr:radical SAM protein [Endomicrobium sp.]
MTRKISKVAEKIFSIKNCGDHKNIKIFGRDIFKFNRNISIKDRLILKFEPSLYVGISDGLTLQLSFSNICNCKCKFCCEQNIVYSKEKEDVIPDKWLYEDFLVLYPRTNHLVPTYGEITVSKKSYEFLSYINKNYPEINVSTETNGIAFCEKWAKLASENLMRINFSLNAINESKYRETVWNQRDIFPLIMNNLDNYCRILKEDGKFAFKPSASMVVNESNYQTIVDFIKLCLKKELQIIVFLMDIKLFSSDCPNNNFLYDTFITLMKIEKLIKDRVFLNYKLFVPVKDLSKLQDIVDKTCMEDLRNEYSDIVSMVKNFKTLHEIHNERSLIRKNLKKKPYSYREELSGTTFHQKTYHGKMICENPWTHLRLRPNGDSAPCSWFPYKESQNVKNYMKNNLIDFNAYFNNNYRKLLRLNFKRHKYFDCMYNCPASKDRYGKNF